MADDVDPAGVGLADAIGQVRAELERAIKDGEKSSVAFRAGPVELEFEVAFTRTGGVSGGFQLSVLSFGAKRDKSVGYDAPGEDRADPGGPGRPGHAHRGHRAARRRDPVNPADMRGGRGAGGAGGEPGGAHVGAAGRRHGTIPAGVGVPDR